MALSGGTIAPDRYGTGFSFARGFAQTPTWIWVLSAGLMAAGVVCLKMSGYGIADFL